MDAERGLDLDTVSFVTVDLILALELFINMDLLSAETYGRSAEFCQYFEEIRQFLPSLVNRVALRDALTQLLLVLLKECANTFSTNEIYARSLAIFTQKTQDDLQTQRVLNGLGNDTPAMLFYTLTDRERLRFRVADYQDASLSLGMGETRGLPWMEGEI